MALLTRNRGFNDVFDTPFALSRTLTPWMDRALGTAFGTSPFSYEGETLRSWYPVMDVSETPDAVVLRMEIPGVPRENVKISVENDVLSIRGEKIQETSSEDESFFRAERSYGTFERMFSLPAYVDADHVKASLHDGVLTIRLPRTEEAKAREVEIEGGENPKRIEA